MLVDHLAFRTGTLDDLRIRSKPEAPALPASNPILPICHGNAWSLYFDDPEGNGVECFVDTPFHVAQPFAQGFDLHQSDAALLEATQKLVEGEPEYQTFAEWRRAFAERLAEH